MLKVKYLLKTSYVVLNKKTRKTFHENLVQYFYYLERNVGFHSSIQTPKLVQCIWETICFENTKSIIPLFDSDHPIRSTGDMQTWYKGRAYEYTKKSHINFCIFDSTWETTEAFELDNNPNVKAWVKNDHLGFEILYFFEGIIRKYRPDFIIKLKTNDFLILEDKGKDTQIDKAKREFLHEWVKAVNEQGGFGKWQWSVSKNPGDIKNIIKTATT